MPLKPVLFKEQLNLFMRKVLGPVMWGLGWCSCALGPWVWVNCCRSHQRRLGLCVHSCLPRSCYFLGRRCLAFLCLSRPV